MKKSFFFVLLGLIGFSFDSSEVALPTRQNESFQIGEKLRYRVTYGIMDAGEAVLELKSTTKTGDGGRPIIHAVATGKTIGTFSLFYKVDDRYETFLDSKGIFPWFFVRRVEEGKYKMSQDYSFQQTKKKVDNGKGKLFDVPIGVQDMISSFYYARTLDYENMKVGQVTEFKCFMDDEIFPLKMKYVGKEEIHIRKGKFRCMKFVPVVQSGRYFKSEDDVNFWITDDKNHIPVLVKAKIPVGIVRLHLVEWSGLKNSLAKL
ncbi:MAG: DUF3108 domain-containing protein [Crocinitomicaceae bacterium]